MDQRRGPKSVSISAAGRRRGCSTYPAPSAMAWAVIGTGWWAPPSNTSESVARS